MEHEYKSDWTNKAIIWMSKLGDFRGELVSMKVEDGCYVTGVFSEKDGIYSTEAGGVYEATIVSPEFAELIDAKLHPPAPRHHPDPDIDELKDEDPPDRTSNLRSGNPAGFPAPRPSNFQ